MKKKYSLFLLFALMSFYPVLFAEEAPAESVNPDVVAEETDGGAIPDEAAVDIETDYTFGTVAKVTAQEIVIKEFDDQAGQEIEVTYKILPDVEWENVQSWEDIQAGDYVEIDYDVINGEKRASFISVESITKPADEDALPAAPAEDLQEAPVPTT